MGPHVHMFFDPATFMFCMGLFGLLTAVISFSSDRSFPAHVRGMRHWALGMLAMALSFFLFCVRGVAPGFFTSFLANEFVLMCPAFNLIGLSLFLGVKPPTKTLGVVMGASVALVGLCYTLDWANRWMVVIVSAPVAAMYLTMVWTLYKHVSLRTTPSAWLTGGSVLLLGLILTVRVFKTLFGNAAASELFAHSETQLIFLMIASTATIAGGMGFILMAHERLRREIKEASLRDGLTGLYTRSAFFEQAAELDKSIEAGDTAPYSVVMVDIDHFKRINDTHGHFSGDVALIHAANLIAQSLRSTDLAARYGGEEFCVLLRGSGPEEAQEFSNRLVASVRAHQVCLPNKTTISFTVSAGYAWRPDPRLAKFNVSVKDLLERADAALYQAKRGGRDQVCAA